MSKCRSCILTKDIIGRPGSHKVCKVDTVCPQCHKSGKMIRHFNDELFGDNFECWYCHDYLYYTDGKGYTWKEEYYFDNGYCLIRSFEDQDSTLIIGNKVAFSIKGLLSAPNKSMFLSKLKTLLTLS